MHAGGPWRECYARLAVYCGLTAFASVWDFRNELPASAFSVLCKSLLPLLGGIGLAFALVARLRDSFSPVYDSGPSIGGVRPSSSSHQLLLPSARSPAAPAGCPGCATVPAKPVTLMAGENLQRHGIPVRSARNRALQHLFTAAPPPIIADALGYHPRTVFTHHEQAAAALP